MTDANNWTISTRVAVRFSGGRARTGRVTVGQANMYHVVVGVDPAHTNASVIVEVPSGTTVDRIAEHVTALMLRHESLRTTLPGDSELRQSVAGEGELSMAVYEAAGDLVACVTDVARRMRAVQFDPATELPLRVAVIAANGAAAAVIFVLCHTAVDTVSQVLLKSEFAALVAGQRLPPPARVQPVDLGELEHTAAGRQRSTASLSYWEDLLRTMPQANFAAAGVGVTDWMLPQLTIRSRAAAPALARIADRTGASRGAVVLAAMSALIGYRLGIRTCVVAMPAANRYLPYLKDYFGSVSQDALMSADVDAATFDELVARVRDRSLAAHRRSWFDSVELWAIMDRVGLQRGTRWARDCVFNDTAALTTPGLVSESAGGEPAGTDLTDAPDIQDLRLVWAPPKSMPTRLNLWALRLEGEVELVLWPDPQCLPTPDAEAFGGAIVRLIIEAADRDVSLDELGALARFRPVVRGDGWYLIDSCWIELAAVRQLLADVLPGRSTLLVPVPDDELGHRLECYVAVGTEWLSPERIHLDCVAALNMRPNAMAPHRYVLCEQAPSDPDDTGAWRERVAIADRDGRALPAPHVAVP